MKKRLLTGLWTVCLLFLVCAAKAQDGQNMAITPEDRDIDRFREQRARMEQGDVDLLWVGDSITHFWENAGKDVFEKYYGNRKAMNFAISGDRTGHVIWRIQHSPMDKINPKMAVVMIGTNNVGHGSSSPAQTVEGIQVIIDMLKKQYPTMKILLLEVFPRDNQPDGKLRQAVNEINEGLRPIYGDNKVENVQLYSINDLLLEKDGVLSPEIMPDFLHPNAAGYEIWAKAIEPMIVEGLGETPEEIVGKPVNSDDWQKRFKEKSELMEKNDYQMVMFGDSITHYWEGGAWPEEEHDSMMKLWDRYYGSKGAINLGIAGDQTYHLVWRLDNYPLDKIHPKLATVLIGVNDIPTGHAIDKIAYANRFIVKKIQKQWPDINIIVLKFLPYAYLGNKEYQKTIDEFNALLPLYLRDLKNVEIVDIGDMYRNEDGIVNQDFFPDRVHPNRDGYLLWGERLKKIVAEKLK